MLKPRFAVWMALVGMVVLGAGAVCSQDYPNKPIRIVSGPAGGGNDFIIRDIAHGISGPLGQPVIVENRPSSVIGEMVSKAPPDGYTLIFSGGSLWITPLLQKMSYDPVRDFSPITIVDSQPNVLVVHPSVAANSVKELITLAKSKPGLLNYASSTTGTSTHLAMELFKSMAGVNIVRIPYKGSAPVVTALLAGEEAQMGCVNPTVAMLHIKTGRLRALAVTSAQPSPLAPGLPTVGATGVPGYEMVSLDAMLMPAKPPAAIIKRLNQEIVRVLNQVDMKEKLLSAGVTSEPSSPEELAAVIKSAMAKWRKVIKNVGISD